MYIVLIICLSFTHSSAHLSIHSTTIFKCLLCARHCSKTWACNDEQDRQKPCPRKARGARQVSNLSPGLLSQLWAVHPNLDIPLASPSHHI